MLVHTHPMAMRGNAEWPSAPNVRDGWVSPAPAPARCARARAANARSRPPSRLRVPMLCAPLMVRAPLLTAGALVDDERSNRKSTLATAKSCAPCVSLYRTLEADHGEGAVGTAGEEDVDGEADEEPRLSKCRHGNEHVSKLCAVGMWAGRAQTRCALGCTETHSKSESAQMQPWDGRIRWAPLKARHAPN